MLAEQTSSPTRMSPSPKQQKFQWISLLFSFLWLSASREEVENLPSDCISSLDRVLVFSVLCFGHIIFYFLKYFSLPFPCVLDFLKYISDKNNLRTSWWKEKEDSTDSGSSKDKIKFVSLVVLNILLGVDTECFILVYLFLLPIFDIFKNQRCHIFQVFDSYWFKLGF